LLHTLLRPAADALAALHAASVTHRAVRPDNIFRGGMGEPASFAPVEYVPVAADPQPWGAPPAGNDPYDAGGVAKGAPGVPDSPAWNTPDPNAGGGGWTDTSSNDQGWTDTSSASDDSGWTDTST